MIRAFLRRARDDESGFTFAEVIMSTVVLGIIMVPLSMAMIVGYRTVFGIQERLASTADVQQLSTYFPQDVQSVDADGVNPEGLEDEGICKATPTEESLITFRWNKDLGDNGQTVVRYLARGSGMQSEIVRRICRGGTAGVETVLARSFGEVGGPEASSYLTDPADEDYTTPVCGTRLCYIDIHGAYDFHLAAQRRVAGEDGSRNPPEAPTNVHALSGFNRVRLYWTDPVSTGGTPITGFYIEQTPPGEVVGGASPVFFPPGTGSTGAVISGLTNFQSYTFRVRAVTIVGNGPWSVPSLAVAPGPTTPEPPTLDAAAGDAATDGRVTGDWSLSADYGDGGSAITGFKLYALNPDSVPTVATIMNPAARTGGVEGLENNTRYRVQVSALNSYGEGSPSPTSDGVLTRPGAPSAPTATGTGTAGTVRLTFSAPEGGELTDLTNFRGKVGSTYSDPVDRATACPDGPTSCSIVVSGVSVNASTSVRVQAQNATGWGADSDPLVIPADTSAPTVTVTFPSNPAYGTNAWNAGCGSAGGAICGTASDAAPGGIASVSLTVRRNSDNRYWNGTAGTSTSHWSSSVQNLTATGTTSWTRAFTTASLQNGVAYTIVATARDSVNLSSTVTRTFTYLTGAPTGNITSPSNGGAVQGTVNVTSNSSATSPATVTSAEFQYRTSPSGTWTTIDVPDTSSPFGVAWTTTALAEGAYDLRVITNDSAGNTNTSTSSVTVTVDNTAPTGELTAPADGAIVRGSVTVSANSADAGSGVASARFQRSPTGADTWTTIGSPDTSSPYSVSWNTTSGTPDGLYDLRVITTDDAGLTFTSTTRTVQVDNTAPVIGAAILTGTLGTNGWYTSDVEVTWPAPTDSGSGIAGTSSGCGLTVISSNVAGQVITCLATDNVGNTASSSVTVKRDADAPTITPTVSGTLGPAGDWYRGTVNLSWATADSPAGVGSTSGCSSQSITSNTAVGGTDYTCSATDNAGNSDNETQNVKRDGTNPSSATLDPLPSTIGANQTFTGSGADALSGVYSVSYYYCSTSSCTPSTLIGTSTAGPTYAVNLDSTLPANGTFRVRARVSDRAGNTLDSSIQQVTFKRPPTVTVSVPLVDADVTSASQPAITGTAGNATGDSTTVTLRIYSGADTAGAVVRTFSLTRSGTTVPAPSAGQWTTAGGALGAGQYTAQAEQTDTAGNTGVSNAQTFFVAARCTLDATEVPADSWVNQASGSSTAGGSDTTLDVASQNSSRNKRALVRFDLAGGAAYSCVGTGESGTLPTSFTARLAQLSLYRTTASSANSRTHNIYAASASWAENTVTWNNQPAVAAGVSATINTGTANGRLTSTESGAISAPSLADDVNDFRSGTNFGWVIRDSSESQSSTNRQVDYGSRTNGTSSSTRPQLVIYYTP